MIGRIVGEGSFGQVRVAKHQIGDFKAAIKIIQKDFVMNNPILQELLANEFAVLEEVSHPNIVKIYE